MVVAVFRRLDHSYVAPASCYDCLNFNSPISDCSIDQHCSRIIATSILALHSYQWGSTSTFELEDLQNIPGFTQPGPSHHFTSSYFITLPSCWVHRSCCRDRFAYLTVPVNSFNFELTHELVGFYYFWLKDWGTEIVNSAEKAAADFDIRIHGSYTD